MQANAERKRKEGEEDHAAGVDEVVGESSPRKKSCGVVHYSPPLSPSSGEEDAGEVHGGKAKPHVR